MPFILDLVRIISSVNILIYFTMGRWRSVLANSARNNFTSSWIWKFFWSFSNVLLLITRILVLRWTNLANIACDPGFLEGKLWHTLISCSNIVTTITFAISTTRSNTSSSLISSTPKKRKLSRRPYCSFDYSGRTIGVNWRWQCFALSKHRCSAKIN